MRGLFLPSSSWRGLGTIVCGTAIRTDSLQNRICWLVVRLLGGKLPFKCALEDRLTQSFGQFLRFGSAPSPSSKDKESKEVLVRRSLDGCVSLYRGMPCSRGARFVPTKRVRPGARNRSLLQRRCPLPVLSDCRDSGRLALRAYIRKNL